MRIIETCPECGADLVTVMVATYPPIETKRCLQCGWYWEEKKEDVVRIPFKPPEERRETVTPYRRQEPYEYMFGYDGIPECCRSCSNHPTNGGSGICCCTLPDVTRSITAPRGKSYTVTTTTYTIPSDGDVIVSDHT